MYTLKSIARRGTLIGASFALAVSLVLPAAPAFADALNPLTERSLLLSSSAPGFRDTDGSNNSETSPNANNENFAPPGSGPNGKKTGETFTFNVSSDSTNRPIEGITFQYCTSAAGNCQSPGNNTGDNRTPNRETNAIAHPLGRSDLEVVGTFTESADATPAAGEFVVLVEGVEQEGWEMDVINREDNAHLGALTGKDNYIRLKHTDVADGAVPTPGDTVQVIFKASTSTYITNPGAGSFFVKINTYDSDQDTDLVPSSNTVIDGGVTVANVMTDSIHITTKVLETMAFSVGTRNRDSIQINCTPVSVTTGCEGASGNTYGTCTAIQNINNNRLNLGDPDAEYSLETGKGWGVNSYWRLSSNSSGGATVYYSGNTLANTVGDEIKDIQTETVSTPGTEQFGLGFVPVEAPHADYATENPGRKVNSYPFKTLATQTGVGFEDFDDLANQPISQDYDQADGTLFTVSGQNILPGTAKFKFLKSSLTVPEPIAQQDEQVISCATAKMRYVGNIAADTPAGVYTTKINYLAAPQY